MWSESEIKQPLKLTFLFFCFPGGKIGREWEGRGVDWKGK